MYTALRSRFFPAGLAASAGLLVLALLAAVSSPVSADPPPGPCPLTAVNDANNNCFTVTALRRAAPIIDGQNTDIDPGPGFVGEWDNAPSKTFIGAFTGSVRFLKQGNDLYFLLQSDDADNDNDGDQFRLFFDVRHDHATITEDHQFRINRNNAGHSVTVNNVESPWAPAAIGIADGGASWTAEVRITAADLAAPDLPEIMGFAARAIDNTSTRTYWPDSATQANPATWANLKTRYPLEHMLVLDQSGSMLSDNRWTSTAAASNYLANVMAIMRDTALGTGATAYFDDRIGVVGYGWNNAANTDLTAVIKPLASIGAFPRGDYLAAAPAVPAPALTTWTPIGRGLNAGFAAVDANNADRQTERTLLLMTDGIHNRPANEVPLLPAHLTYNPCAAMGWACPPGTPTNVTVNTVVVGNDATAATGLLQDIATRYGGERSLFDVVDIAEGETLKETYITSLADLFRLNLLARSVNGVAHPAGADILGGGISVDPDNRKLVFILSWTDPTQAANFTIQRRATAVDPWQDVPCAQAGSSTAVGFAMCLVNAPQSGLWRAQQPADPSQSQFVLADLNLRARFAVDQAVHGTGLDIILTADLNQAGRQLTHDPANHPVSVTAFVEKPSEGFGTFVSTHSIEGCRTIVPQLPQGSVFRTVDRGMRAGGLQAGAVPADHPLSLAAATSTGNDRPTPRFLLMESLLKGCGKNGLTRGSEPPLQLHDDGTQGDLAPGDGIYTLRFANTSFEGSYVFRFNAVGKTPDGQEFGRTQRMAAYVRVEVDPANTAFDSRILDQGGTRIVREFYVTPRDRFGGYLGPGFPDQIGFSAVHGEWITDIIDYNNGIYSRVLSYDPTQGDPGVAPVVQGKSVGKPPPGCPVPFPPPWLCVLIILALLLIILLLLLKRRRP